MKFSLTLFIVLISLTTFAFEINTEKNNSNTKQKYSENILNNISFTLINGEANISPIELGKYVPITGNIEQLKYFFNSLKESKRKKIRIAHFGDSQIQGDIISAYIREKLQNIYGGRGAGYLAIQSNDIRMRLTTEHSFSDDWNYAAVITRNPEKLPYGMSGSVAVPKPGSWVKYRATNYLKSSSSFEVARLFYSNADKSSMIEYKINNGRAVKLNLESGSELQELVIDAKTSATTLEIKFLSGKQPYFYGVSLESGNGLYLDNFPMPGNTGASLLEIPINNLQGFDNLCNYSLIILSYGNNVSSTNRGIYTVYENKMHNVIEHLRKAFPNTSILMFSVNDKTIKQGNRFITNPDVPLLLNTQKKIVEKSKIAFWNLWEAMGGTNSMNEWVSSAPPMALKDYSHFTPNGGERVAELFLKSLLDTENKIEK